MEEKPEEVSLDFLVNPSEFVSGMHMVNEENHWSYPNSAEDDIEKQATGLTSLLSSSEGAGGGEVLQQQRVPQPPGQRRDLGDDEDLEFFLASGPLDLPPKNRKYQEVYEGDEPTEEMMDDIIATHIARLSDSLKRIGKEVRSKEVLSLFKKSKLISGDDTEILSYIQARDLFLKEASSSKIQIDVDIGAGAFNIPTLGMQEISFDFKGGEWFYNHGLTFSLTSVDAIAKGDNPTFIGGVLSPSSMGFQSISPSIRSLCGVMSNNFNTKSIDKTLKVDLNLLGGVVYLGYSIPKAGGSLDWDTYAKYYFDSFSRLLESDPISVVDPGNPTDSIDINFGVLKTAADVEKSVALYLGGVGLSAPSSAPSGPAPAGTPTTPAPVGGWTARNVALKAPWQAFAVANGLGSDYSDADSWFIANKDRLGLGGMSDMIKYLSGKTNPTAVKLPITTPIASPPSKITPTTSTINDKNIILDSINRTLSGQGQGVGNRADERMSKFVTLAGGNANNLADVIIGGTAPANLKDVLTNKQELDRMVLRLAKRTTRKRLI
jgi:hypothetical protein